MLQERARLVSNAVVLVARYTVGVAQVVIVGTAPLLLFSVKIASVNALVEY